MSQARAKPKLAAYMWKCVGVIGHDYSRKMEFPQGVSLDIINEFFSQWLLVLNMTLLEIMICL